MDSNAQRVVIHLSDLHFGRDDRRIVRALHDAVWTLSPDVVAVSGDLTQRARRRQFLRARAFLNGLPQPLVIVPGNHDVPLFNVLARLLYPLGGYTTHITGDLEPTLVVGPLWIAGINTTRPSTWKSGAVDPTALQRLQASLREVPTGAVRILVAHHPFDAPDHNPATTNALGVLIAAGIDVFLTGHLHASYSGHTAHRYNVGGRTAVVVEAGTATSTRLRAEANAFNVLRISPDAIEVELRTFAGQSFSVSASQRFSRTSNGWTPQAG